MQVIASLCFLNILLFANKTVSSAEAANHSILLWQIHRLERAVEKKRPGSQSFIKAKNYNEYAVNSHRSEIRIKKHTNLYRHAQLKKYITHILHYNFENSSPFFNGIYYQEKFYNPLKMNEAAEGSYSALFDGSGNRKIVLKSRKHWYTNSMSVSFWFKPLMIDGSSKNIIYSQTLPQNTETSQKRRGLAIGFQDNRMNIQLENLIEKTLVRKSPSGNRQISLNITGSHLIHRNKWNFFQLDIIQPKKITSYLNGREDASYSLANQKMSPDLSRYPIHIGEDFFGYLDDLRLIKNEKHRLKQDEISRQIYPHLLLHEERNSLENSQGVSWAISQVIEPADLIAAEPDNRRRAYRARLYATKEMPAGTRLDLFVRTSLNRFTEENAEQSTTAAEPSSSLLSNWKLVKKSDIIAPFRYLQWKALLRADPSGRKSPRLFDVVLDLTLPAIPPNPQKVKKISCPASQGLCAQVKIPLVWLDKLSSQTTEENVDLKVHLGVRPQKYALSFSLRENDIQYQLENQYITIKIANADISRALFQDRQRRFPLLTNDRHYYLAFSLTSIYGSSDLSKELHFYVP